MSFAVEKWLELLVQKALDTFSDRVKFIGLQGSYRRGEATEKSDIDVVIILDQLNQEDLKQYKQIIESMPQSEKACGFISGMKEIYYWPKHESFQLYYDTKALYGDLRWLLRPFDHKDVADSIRIGASALYHNAIHSYLYGDAGFDSLRQLYKSAFFILQSVYFLRTQKYISTKQSLLPLLEGEDKKILEICIALDSMKERVEEESDLYFEMLINWSSEKMELVQSRHSRSPKRIAFVKRQYFPKKQKWIGSLTVKK